MVKKFKMRKIKRTTYCYWDDVGKPTKPLTEEKFKKFWESMDKPPPKYLYLGKSKIDIIIEGTILNFIKILDNIVGYIINIQTKLFHYIWKRKEK